MPVLSIDSYNILYKLLVPLPHYAQATFVFKIAHVGTNIPIDGVISLLHRINVLVSDSFIASKHFRKVYRFIIIIDNC